LFLFPLYFTDARTAINIKWRYFTGNPKLKQQELTHKDMFLASRFKFDDELPYKDVTYNKFGHLATNVHVAFIIN